MAASKRIAAKRRKKRIKDPGWSSPGEELSPGEYGGMSAVTVFPEPEPVHVVVAEKVLSTTVTATGSGSVVGLGSCILYPGGWVTRAWSEVSGAGSGADTVRVWVGIGR